MLSIIGGGNGDLGVLDSLYVKGDDDGLWYACSMSLVDGAYFWSSGGPTTLPSGTVNISDRVLGDSLFVRDGDEIWHQFGLIMSDTGAYTWTDADQTATVPTVRQRRRLTRAEDGVYIIDSDGLQVHKMGVTGGLWSELAQGYGIPL